MKLFELKKNLNQQPAAELRFLLPNGEFVPAHAHVTEIARIDKRFVDCGGTFRTDSYCRLQTWFAADVEHRLTAGKLLKILDKAESFLETEDLEVDVEHEVGFISQFSLESIEVSQGEMIFHLTVRHTACLAPDKCMPPSPPADFDPMKFNFREGHSSVGCCSEKSNAKL